MCILECPNEILWMILEYLNCTDLMSMHKTCRHLYVFSKTLLNHKINTITLQESMKNDDVIGFRAIIHREIHVPIDLIPMSLQENAPKIFKSILKKCNLESYTELNYIIETIACVDISFLNSVIKEHYRYKYSSMITKLMLSCVLRRCSYPLLDEFLRNIQISYRLITPDIIYFALTYRPYISDRCIILLLSQINRRGWKLRYDKTRLHTCLCRRQLFSPIEESLLRSLRRSGAIIKREEFIR